jgi:divalent metal cation (Fe/Co/Zn/Cd) transporter
LSFLNDKVAKDQLMLDAPARRQDNLRRGLAVESATIGWMVVEAMVALSVGVMTRSGAALAFGLDSLIELGSAGVLVWRLRAEFGAARPAQVEEVEHRARRLVGGALFALAGYTVLQSGAVILLRVEPEPSPVGIGLAVAAVVGMPILAQAKRNVANAIGSAALRGDAACSLTCAYMAAALLVGLVLNVLFGWWWADPLAALGIVFFLIREGREAWNDEACCDECAAERSQSAGLDDR